MIRDILILALALLAPHAHAAANPHFIQGFGQAHKIVNERPDLVPDKIDGMIRNLLHHPDVVTRFNAAKFLKEHVLTSVKARQALMQVYTDVSIDLDLRHRAAKSLSPAAPLTSVRDALLATAETPSEDSSLRAISYKALYTEFARDPSSRSPLVAKLVDVVKNEKDPYIRRGAIWALFPVSKLSYVRKVLLHIGIWEKDTDTRIQALKSLFRGMDDASTQKSIRQMALDKKIDRTVRFPAVLLLSAIRTNEINDLLIEIAIDNDEHKMIRTAASIAFDRENDHLKIYFRLPYVNTQGEVVDHLEYE